MYDENDDNPNWKLDDDFKLSLAVSKQRRAAADRHRAIQRRLSFLLFFVVISCFVLFLILYPR